MCFFSFLAPGHTRSSSPRMYSYQALPTPQHIRLLILDPARDPQDPVSCTLLAVSLAENHEFEALSYVWGDATTKRRVKVASEELNVTINLQSALQHLRYNDDRQRVLWVDAICIDQSNLDERGEQVQMMGQIYSKAQKVVVWLGEMTEDMEKSFESIRFLDTFLTKHDTEGYSEGPVAYDKRRNGSVLTDELADFSQDGFDWDPVISIIKRPWFQRLWVVQEVAQTGRAVVVCGSQTLPWNVLEKSIGALKMHGLLDYFAQKAGTINFDNLAGMALIRQRHGEIKRPSNLLDLIADTRNFQCTDPRDKVFALLGLATNVGPQDVELTPNYRMKVEEVYTNFTIWNITQAGNLHALSYSTSDPSRVTKPSLPSWVPDYTALEVAGPLVKMENRLPFDAAKGSHPGVRVSDKNTHLHIVGQVIDTIDKIGSIQADISVPDSLVLSELVRLQQDTENLVQNALWIKECVDIASGGQTTMTLERNEDFRRCMIRNRGSTDEVATAEDLALVDGYVEFIIGTAFEDHDMEWVQTMATSAQAIDRTVTQWQRYRRFCITGGGRLGWLPAAALAGDAVCILHGGQVPYVIRPVDGGVYQWVGECYIQGTMEGEVSIVPEELTIQ